MRPNERQGMLLPAAIALLALLANAAVFALHTYPTWRQRSAAQTRLDAAESELHAVRQQIRELETIGRSALGAGDDLRVFVDQRLRDAAAMPEVLQHVRDTAAAAGVALESIDHTMEAVEQLDAERWQMSTFGAGSYAALRSWMSALRRGPGLLFVDSVEIGSSGGPVLSVELTLVTLLRADASGAPVRP